MAGVERIRPLGGRRATTCPDCGVEVGAQPEYNYSIASTGTRPGAWRVAAHKRGRVPSAERCSGSRTFIPEDTVYERKQLDATA